MHKMIFRLKLWSILVICLVKIQAETCTGDILFPKLLHSDACAGECNDSYYSAVTANNEALFVGGHVG